MENLFDSIQDTAFGIVSNTMGYNATWVPSNNAPAQNARILFKDASQTAKLLQIEYDPARAIIEYKIGDFTGLKELVDSKSDEMITVSGITYGVNAIEAKYDGKTFYAHLQVI